MSETVAGDELRAFIERIEHVEQEISDLGNGKKEIYAELKGRGYDVKVIRKIVARRKRDRNELAEEDAVMSLYLQAMGEQLPLDLMEAA